jgi:hypothetical protein
VLIIARLNCKKLLDSKTYMKKVVIIVLIILISSHLIAQTAVVDNIGTIIGFFQISKIDRWQNVYIIEVLDQKHNCTYEVLSLKNQIQIFNKVKVGDEVQLQLTPFLKGKIDKNSLEIWNSLLGLAQFIPKGRCTQDQYVTKNLNGLRYKK